jgi:hypothetical protein
MNMKEEAVTIAFPACMIMVFGSVRNPQAIFLV